MCQGVDLLLIYSLFSVFTTAYILLLLKLMRSAQSRQIGYYSNSSICHLDFVFCVILGRKESNTHNEYLAEHGKQSRATPGRGGRGEKRMAG